MYFCQMLLGLHYLHQRNLVHRDIKPLNILMCHGINPDGTPNPHHSLVKLGDFGLCVRLRSPTDFVKTTFGTKFPLADPLFSSHHVATFLSFPFHRDYLPEEVRRGHQFFAIPVTSFRTPLPPPPPPPYDLSPSGSSCRLTSIRWVASCLCFSHPPNRTTFPASAANPPSIPTTSELSLPTLHAPVRSIPLSTRC
jgi:serine/threonine protein kinase